MNKIDKIVSSLSFDEKIKLIMGDGYWKFNTFDSSLKQVTCTDGPYGVRITSFKKDDLTKQTIQEDVPVTTYPAGCCLSCSFDPNIAYLEGKMLANESRYYGIDVLLGPAVNIKRNPLCGRNFEYLSEDPLLSGIIGGNWIKGIEDNKVGSSLKHFALNNQEYGRLLVSSNVSLKAMHDIYLKPFEIAIKIKSPATIMCSYNKVNGIYSSENKYLLSEVLRSEFNYDGIVISDWGAVSDRFAGIKAGLDIEMPERHYPENYFKTGLENGDYSIEDLDKLVKRIILFNKKYNKEKKLKKIDFNKNYLASRQIAENSIVLAKNDDNFFPLKKEDEIIVLGYFAKYTRFQGGGSSHTRPQILPSFIDILNKNKVKYRYFECFNDKDNVDDVLALNSIRDQKVLVFLGLFENEESEGRDRNSLELSPSQLALMEHLQNYKNVGVILELGSVVSLPFINNIKGLLIPYLGGCAVNDALFNIVYGYVNPSGKLSEAWINKLSDNPSSLKYDTDPYNAFYQEDIYVGYRYYQKNDINVTLPFGFGLSYSNFELSNPKAKLKKKNILLKVDVTNTSNIFGKCVIQCYSHNNSTNLYSTLKDLCAFRKVALKPNESKTVKILIDLDSLKKYSTSLNKNILEDGDYTIYIGQSSMDLLLSIVLHISGEKVEKEEFVPLDEEIKYFPNIDMNIPPAKLIENEYFKKLLSDNNIDVSKMSKRDYEDIFLLTPLRAFASMNGIDYADLVNLFEKIKKDDIKL